MSNYVPFPELAAAFQGAGTAEVVDAIHLLEDAVVKIHKVKFMEIDYGIDRKTIKRKLQKPRKYLKSLCRNTIKSGADIVGRDSPHLLSTIDPRKLLMFIFTRVDTLVGDPLDIAVAHQHSYLTNAEAWLLQCIIDTDSDSDSQLRYKWSEYLVDQPLYCQHQSAQHN